MIFYFSGILPLRREKCPPPDVDMQFFENNGGQFNRLVCLHYQKEADTVIYNTLHHKEKADGNGNEKRSRRRT